MRCQVKGNYYKNNTIGVTKKKITEKVFLRNRKRQKWKVCASEAIQMCSTAIHNDCCDSLDYNNKLNSVIFISSNTAKIISLLKKSLGYY